MKKIINFVSENVLLLMTVFLLFFIPLYPKLPLFGINHTFVYIRADDFVVALTLFIYLILLIRKKVNLKTPLTHAIIAYWLIGLVATVLGVIFIFPHLQNVFPKIAFLFYLRHIEYMALFFVAFSAVRSKRYVHYVILAMVTSLSCVVIYGVGQRFFPIYFPAFSTMNEEFAKGIPLTLSALGRVQSTFAGHYDLAAYLVMMIPLTGSLVFGYKKWVTKILLLFIATSSVIVLLMTESRTSFGMYLVATGFMLTLHKQKKWIIPVIIISLVLLKSFSGLYDRYAATLAPVDVVVDARTGKAIGIAKQTESGIEVDKKQSNGESLPSSQSQFLGLQNGGKAIDALTINKMEKGSAVKSSLEGDFLVKKAQALDISIATRLQAEWPNAINAFKRDIFFGSGYSTISLATDGNYFRILGETGILGLTSFLFIFFIFAVYSWRIFPQIESKLSKSLIIGINAGILGLALNAVLIDVFEASKVAYMLWMLIGIGMGVLVLNQKNKINILQELRKFLLSVPLLILYIVIAGYLVFMPMLNNFFVADDFTWLRWAVDCKTTFAGNCDSQMVMIRDYLLHADSFFYRPGAKIYYYYLYSKGTIDPFLYHFASLFLHILVSSLAFFLGIKILKSKWAAFLISVLFLLLASHAEAVFWISAAGHLFTTYCSLSGLLFYILWREKKQLWLLILSLMHIFAAPLFQEFGIVAPLLVGSYIFIYESHLSILKTVKNAWLWIYMLQIPLYLIIRVISGSTWGNSSYSYNIVKLPFNAIGNLFGYMGLIAIGPAYLSINQVIRETARAQMVLTGGLSVLLFMLFMFVIYFVAKAMNSETRKNILFSLLFIIISLLPVLGLGNIAERYSYMASLGLIFLVVSYLKSLFEKKNIFAVIILSVMLCGLIVFTVLQVFLVRSINQDWNKAGESVKQTLNQVGTIYASESKLPKNTVFFFVNPPTKYGDAWVFPVGLNDAMWYLFQDDSLTVKTFSSLELAKKNVTYPQTTKIFNFSPTGKIGVVGSEK